MRGFARVLMLPASAANRQLAVTRGGRLYMNGLLVWLLTLVLGFVRDHVLGADIVRDGTCNVSHLIE